MVKGIIWDFNGTLFDDSAIHLAVWQEIYERLTQGKGDFSEFKKNLIGTHNKTLLERIYKEIAKDLSKAESERLSKEKEWQYRDFAIKNDLCKLTKGAERLLNECVEHDIRMDLCSTSIYDNILFYFQEFHLDRWLDINKTVYDHEDGKAKSEMYKEAAANLGLDIRECIIFEDSDYGIKSAIASGCRGVIVIDKSKTQKVGNGIIQVVADFDEVDRELLFGVLSVK